MLIFEDPPTLFAYFLLVPLLRPIAQGALFPLIFGPLFAHKTVPWREQHHKKDFLDFLFRDLWALLKPLGPIFATRFLFTFLDAFFSHFKSLWCRFSPPRGCPGSQ